MPVISTNTAANSALRYLNLNSDQQSNTLSKLASGSRITKASDDAAGLAIASRLQSDVTVLNQAATNSSQAQSILQTADGGLARVGDILQRMKSLATQSYSGSVTDTERAYVDSEYQQLADEIDDLSAATRYNGESLLDGSATSAWNTTGVAFMVGTDVTDTITVTIDEIDGTTLTDGTTTVAASAVDTAANAQLAISSLDAAIDMVSQARANVGAIMSRFEFRSESIATSDENLSAAQSAIMDADVASEKSDLASQDVKTQAAIAALTQATQLPQELLSLLQS